MKDVSATKGVRAVTMIGTDMLEVSFRLLTMPKSAVVKLASYAIDIGATYPS